jgi:hypothetical protein
MAAPILVTGSNRSGTTWLGRLLAEAQGTVFVNEIFNVAHPQPGLLGARFPHWFMYLDDELGRPYVEPLQKTLELRYDWAGLPRSVRSPRDVVRAARAYRCTRVPAGSRALLKDPIAVFSAPWLERTFGMRVVLTVRHPAGFAASLKRLDWRFDFANFTAQPRLMDTLPTADRELITRYAATPPSIIHQASLLWRVIYGRPQGARWLTVRQEDLAAAPEHHVRAIYAALGLEFTPEIGAHVRRVTAAENPADAPDGQAHTRARDSVGAIGAWRRQLDADEISLVRELAGSVAERFYAESDW